MEITMSSWVEKMELSVPLRFFFFFFFFHLLTNDRNWKVTNSIFNECDTRRRLDTHANAANDVPLLAGRASSNLIGERTGGKWCPPADNTVHQMKFSSLVQGILFLVLVQ